MPGFESINADDAQSAFLTAPPTMRRLRSIVVGDVSDERAQVVMALAKVGILATPTADAKAIYHRLHCNEAELLILVDRVAGEGLAITQLLRVQPLPTSLAIIVLAQPAPAGNDAAESITDVDARLVRPVSPQDFFDAVHAAVMRVCGNDLNAASQRGYLAGPA